MIERRNPYRFELLFADPDEISDISSLERRADRPWDRARWLGTLPGDWDRQRAPLMSHPKQKALRRHLVDGVPWRETGLYEIILKGIRERGMCDGCRNLRDIERRYSDLDRTYDRIRADGRLRVPWELEPGPSAQATGVRVRLDRQGRIMFAGRGNHRLALAKMLEHPIPVALHIAHPQAVRDGHLECLRRRRDEILRDLGLELPKHALGVPRVVPRFILRRLAHERPETLGP